MLLGLRIGARPRPGMERGALIGLLGVGEREQSGIGKVDNGCHGRGVARRGQGWLKGSR